MYGKWTSTAARHYCGGELTCQARAGGQRPFSQYFPIDKSPTVKTANCTTSSPPPGCCWLRTLPNSQRTRGKPSIMRSLRPAAFHCIEIELLKDPGVPLGNMGTTGSEGHSSPLAIADDNGSSKEDECLASCEPCIGASPVPVAHALTSTSLHTSILGPSASS